MYGYEIPRYAKEYLSEWRRSDSALRLRWSQDQQGMFILERKTVYRVAPAYYVERGSDRAIQFKDRYRMVFRFQPNEIQYVARSLALTDAQRYGGGKALATRLEAAEDKETELMDRAYRNECEAAASELYDMLAWEEKRRVSLARA